MCLSLITAGGDLSIFADVVALKKSTFVSRDSPVAGIYNKALLCNGDEETLFGCKVHGDGSVGGKRCPMDNSEDAGVKCNGKTLHLSSFEHTH